MNKPSPILFDEAGGGDAGGGSGTAVANQGQQGSLLSQGGTAAGAAATNGGSAVAETWWKGYMKEDGALDKTRLDHLPADLKESRSLFERYGKADDIFKSFAHQAKLLSEKGLTPLREGATPAEIAEHATRLRKVTGAPDKPEGYAPVLKRPDSVPEQLWNPKLADEFAKIAHKHGASPAFVKDIVEMQSKMTLEAVAANDAAVAEEQKKSRETVEAELRTAFGPLFDYRMKEALAGAKWGGISPDHPLFSDAAGIRFAAKVASAIKEAAHVDGKAPDVATASAQSQLDSLARDPAHPLYAAIRDPNHPQHGKAIETQTRLSRQAAQEEIEAQHRR